MYLRGLNGLRALAACSVILAHFCGILVEKGFLKSNYFGHFGGYSVTIFFTLSGFLITYLLLKELEFQAKVDIKKFYMRRILRIWPLYFFYIVLVVLAMKFMLPSTIWYYIFIVPNIPFALHLSGHAIVTIPLLTHYWSVGVEEQFYAFWPWLIKYSSKIKRSIFLFCAAYFGLKIGLSVMNAPIFWQSILLHTRFCCLGIGAIGACLYFENSKIVAFSNKKVIEILAWLILMLFMMNQISVFSIVNNEIISIMVVIIIFNQINNPSPILSLENRVFDYLGKISFGLYIYNPLLISLISIFFLNDNTNGFLKVILFVLITFGAIILVSHLSYFYFEKRFLNLKNRFTTIESYSSNPNN